MVKYSRIATSLLLKCFADSKDETEDPNIKQEAVAKQLNRTPGVSTNPGAQLYLTVHQGRETLKNNPGGLHLAPPGGYALMATEPKTENTKPEIRFRKNSITECDEMSYPHFNCLSKANAHSRKDQ